MKVNIVRTNENAKMPSRESEHAAGYDLSAPLGGGDIAVGPHKVVKIHTGLKMEIPEGYFGALFARSGTAINRDMRPANCVGVIDSDYRGEVIIAIRNDSDETRFIEPGERIAQMVIMPYMNVEYTEVEELSETVRGEGGVGSTGRK